MVQPIQYTVKAPSAFESLVSGLKLGTSLQEMQAQRALREQQALQIQANMEQKRQQQEALNAIRSARPEDMTQEFVNRYTGLIPAEQQRLMREQFNRYDTQRQNVLAGQYGQMAQMAFSGVDDAQVNGFFDQLIAAQDSESAKKALEVERKAFLSAPDKDLYGKQKLIMLRGLGEKGKDVADQVNSLNRAKTESLGPEATPEILRAIDLLGLPRNIDSIRRYSEATQRPETKPALQKAQAYRQTLQQRGMQNTPEYAENEQYIRNLLVDPTAQTQAQIEANRIAQARLDQSERLNDPLYVENLAAARARGTAAGESASGKEALKNAAVATLSSIGYNTETGEDDVSRLISQSTGGGLGATADAVARYFGEATRGAAAINTLKAVSADMTLNVLGGKLGAGISNPDRDFIEKRFGDIGNEKLSRAERYAAWQAAKNRMVQVGMLPKPRPRGAAQQQTQTPQPVPAGGAPRQPTVSNW